MMKKACLLILLITSTKAMHAILPAYWQERYYGRHNGGIDLSQFVYFTGPNKKGFNGGAFYQFQPFRFLAFNASGFVNNVYWQRNQGYAELVDYESHGLAVKAGLELSLRLSRSKNSRLFFGYQEAMISYRESGRFFVDGLYWGVHERAFNLPARTYLATEWIFGFEFCKDKWIFRPQFYGMFADHDARISSHDEVVTGYKSPFIPGFGFIRGGVNLLLLYKLN